MGCGKEVSYRHTSMDDLSSLLNCCNTGCVSGDTIINHMMYADDLVLISPSATGMKELLCACEVYSLEHAIVYNSKKSTVLVCRNKAMRHAVRPSFIVNGDVIPETDKVKYLGHIICSDLSDDEDMMRQRVIYMLKGMFYLEVFICVRSMLRILYSVPFVLECIHVTCGGTIRHRAFIS